jgi:hypothetical protein
VPDGAKSLLVYVYDPDDYNRNNFDVVVRYGQEVAFVEDPPGSGRGHPVYDWGSFSAAAYEECPIFNNDASPIAAGDYYFALLSNGGTPGGPVGMKACVDGVFRTLADGEQYAKTIEAHTGSGGSDCGQQCAIDVPSTGVTQVLVTVEPAALAAEFMLVVRAGAPIGLAADLCSFDPSLPDTKVFDALGGYEEMCLPVDRGGFRLYVEAFGLSALAQEAIVSVRFNACGVALPTGAAGCIDKIIPGIRYDPAVATNEAADAVQYRVTVTPENVASCARGGLALSIAQTNIASGEENVDFLVYCNFGAPIPLRADDGLPDFEQAPGIVFQNATSGPGAETIVFKDDALVAGEYWFLVSRDPGSADAPPAFARLCAMLSCGASFRRGYINGDAVVNVADAVSLLGYLFAFKPPPACLDAGDVNDDGKVNIADAVSLLGYLFASRPPPAAPFAACDSDPTPDDVTCDAVPVQCVGK